MSVRLVGIAGTFALGLLLSGNAPAQDAAPAKATQARTIDPDTQQQLSAARDAEQSGRFPESVRAWTALAERGVPEAQVHLGILYHEGSFGVCRNDTEALDWLTQAADKGSVDAYYSLGNLYDSYNSPLRDPDKALAWYQKAAELDDAASQSILSQKYWNGDGVPKDRVKAIYWLEKAAAYPRPVAIFQAYDLGNIYSDGKDVPPNEEKAIYWYLKAANGGLVNAQIKVADYYEKRQDYARAYYWYALVKNVAARDRMAANLTPAQLAEARKRVADTKFPPADMSPPPAIPLTRGCPALS